MLIFLVGTGRVIDTGLFAFRGNLLDVVAQGESLAVDVMSALLHGVVVAGSAGSVVTASDDAGVLEPLPGGADLATVTAHGLALEETTAGGGVRDRKESREVATSRDADTIVEGLSGTVGPARATVGLIADVVDDGLALGPLHTRIEVGGQVVVDDHGGVAGALSDGPIGVNDGAHDALDLLEGCASEFVVVASDPVGLRVGVDSLDMSAQIDGLLLLEKVKDVTILAKLHGLAGSLRLEEVKGLSLVSEVANLNRKLGELLVKVIELDVAAIGSEVDGGLTKLADVVVFGKEVVNFGGAGNSGENGESEGTHSV